MFDSKNCAIVFADYSANPKGKDATRERAGSAAERFGLLEHLRSDLRGIGNFRNPRPRFVEPKVNLGYPADMMKA